MELVICISNYCQNKTYYKITPSKIHDIKESNNNRTIYNLEILQKTQINKCRNVKVPVVPHVMRRYRLNIDGINFYYLNKELLNFLEFRRLLTTHMNLNGINLLWFQIVQPEREIIDWKWNRMLSIKLWEKIETDYLMSWLSTLGGAFSALGDNFSKCAEMAGKISKKQLMIGIKLDDPFQQSRCRLFNSISLIQTGRLRSAKYIIREQYKFARRHEETDRRLVKMCKGIWLKLQYEYACRLKARKSGPLYTKGSDGVNN